MRRQLGRSVGALITESYEMRRVADYDPQASFPEHVVTAKMKAIRTHVLWICRESRKVLR